MTTGFTGGRTLWLGVGESFGRPCDARKVNGPERGSLATSALRAIHGNSLDGERV